MILKTASYNSGTSTHAALAAEANVLSYSLNHEFNAPATATIVLADPTGSMAQKYDVDTNAVYVGPGRAYIEDPDATCIFDGRILKARHDTVNGRVILLCQDWLSQLGEERINYDMRADLGSGLREGTVSSRPHDERLPVKTVGLADYMYDDGMNWVPDNTKWVSHYVVFSNAMAGKQTIGAGPYARTLIGDPVDTETYTDDIGDLWADDAAVHTYIDNENYIIYQYQFPIIVTESAFYVASSISGARVHVTYSLHSTGGDDATHAQVFASVDGADNYLTTLPGTDAEIHRGTYEVAGSDLSDLIDGNGWGYCYFAVKQDGTDTVTWKVYYIRLEVDVETTGDNAAHDIDISHLDYIGTTTDLTLANANYGIWEGCQYSFILPIYKHIASDESPGDLITGGDDLMTLTCAATIEHTSGMTTRHYNDRSRLDILKDLANMDKAVFWITLGGVVVTWKSTFNDGTPTEITDASVLSWSGGEYDYEPMRNEYNLYGVRIGDNQLFVNTGDLTPDPGVDSKTKYGMTRSDAIKSTGTTSIYETESLGKAIVERDEDVLLLLRAVVEGRSALRLGEELNVNSTLLGLTDQKYVITHWSYDSTTHRTTIRIHPRVSAQGYISHIIFGEHIRHIADTAKQAQLDTHSPDLYTQTWS